MGTLRTLFAVSVVLAHSWPNGSVMLGGRVPVELFYVISGFLISFILVENKSYKTHTAFYVNRVLRLYPIYAVVALITLASIVATHKASFFSAYTFSPWSARALLIASNALIFGQDWVMFSGVRDHALVFTPNYLDSDVILYGGLLVPQAWTLGLELCFYVLAPFVLPRRNAIYTMLGAAVAVRIVLLSTGWGTKDPWTYRFFPAEIGWFLLGALAHQELLPRFRRLPRRVLSRLAAVATFGFAVVSVSFSALPVAEATKECCLFLGFVLLMPLTFLFQNQHRFDNWIGNLSYPIYIGHEFIYFALAHLARRYGEIDFRWIAGGCVLLAVAFAMLLNHFVAEPIEAIRRRLKSAAAARGASHTA